MNLEKLLRNQSRINNMKFDLKGITFLSINILLLLTNSKTTSALLHANDTSAENAINFGDIPDNPGTKRKFPMYIVVWSFIGGIVGIVAVVSLVRAIYRCVTHQMSDEEKMAVIRRKILGNLKGDQQEKEPTTSSTDNRRRCSTDDQHEPLVRARTASGVRERESIVSVVETYGALLGGCNTCPADVVAVHVSPPVTISEEPLPVDHGEHSSPPPPYSELPSVENKKF